MQNTVESLQATHELHLPYRSEERSMDAGSPQASAPLIAVLIAAAALASVLALALGILNESVIVGIVTYFVVGLGMTGYFLLGIARKDRTG
ncbi:hypothetical protein [Natronohydrobacter thiooxidans]|uniref:hypothetical protein n=1 Tax=Natronohydrobacter thiooxidans TaxID=87172 RepID=UPI0008FF12F9|nr:hypothetical protein [Natronohydrobacter thiooxidans]